MSQLASPYGFRPVGVLGQEYNTNGFSEYPLITNSAAAITVGDPVAFVAGSVAPVVAAPAAGTLSANSPIGIAWGFTYIDAMGKIWETPYLPANSISNLGFTKVTAKIIDDPDALMYIQPNGTLPTITIGKNATFTNFGTTKTQSTISLDAASIANSATLPLRILRVDNLGDPFPDVVVIFTWGAHALRLPLAQ
jgi:hypothetical protein